MATLLDRDCEMEKGIKFIKDIDIFEKKCERDQHELCNYTYK